MSQTISACAGTGRSCCAWLLAFVGMGAAGLLAGCATLAMPEHVSAAETLDVKTEIAPFAREVAERHGLSVDQLEKLLEQARVLPGVLDAISRPAEAKPWYQYRPIFLTEQRIAAGVAFWNRHAGTLARAEQVYGVPASIIVAIIGVETFYGERSGRTRVLDSLATLGFRYQRRGAFFRGELEQFLVLCHDEGLDPLTVRGSYAGAMGIPQFIPSSYRRYAVDFDGDHVRNLLTSDEDAIGSVANYLARHGWKRGAPIAVPARVSGSGASALVERGLKPSTAMDEMERLGVAPVPAVDASERGALIELDGEKSPEYWIGFDNFYVITRYNHSPLYAMAVAQLAAAISERRGLPAT